MAIYLSNGEVFSPNKEELLNVLFYLKGVFEPSSFSIFENDYNKRAVLAKSMEKPFLYMDLLSESADHPDLNLLGKDVEGLLFSGCARYMMFFLRLIKRQGGGDAFIQMWKSGVIEKLVDKMLLEYDGCSLE